MAPTPPTRKGPPAPSWFTAAVLGDDLRELLGPRIPVHTGAQTSAEAQLDDCLRAREQAGARVLDLGCGAGDSIDLFRRLAPDARWSGVDIDESPEVAMRARDDGDFHTFDGERLPFGDAEFDVVWCKQVLEHVETPRTLLTEVARVLRPGGVLIGSTSQLEPFHSRSTANPTPYGLSLALEAAGLRTTSIRPSIDSLTLIARRAVGGGAFFDRWWTRESPVNRAIDLYARVRRLEPTAVSAAKLVLCGQFVFAAERPSAGQPEA